jgi:hypothetical protein
MTAAPVRRVCSPDTALPLSAFVLGLDHAARRQVIAIRNAVEDVSACLSESRRHDALHDAYAANLERLALVGIRSAAAEGCSHVPRFQAMLRDAKGLQAANARDGDCVMRAWTIVKRLAGCLGQALTARRRAGP